MLQLAELDTLWRSLSAAGRLSQRFLSDAYTRSYLAPLVNGSSLGGRLDHEKLVCEMTVRNGMILWDLGRSLIG